MQAERLEAAGRFLKSRGMAATDEWLIGCIEYFGQQTPGGSVQDLLAMVNSQWTLSDLRDMSPGCLPSGLCDTIKTQLNGLYALQMNSIIDVGSPAYKQWQDIKKMDIANVEATRSNENREPPIQRLLKLSITDGVQNIHAIEYKPMRNLSTSLTPGIKLQIKGPVDCRRGVLMLEEKHLTVLGGEVDDLIESNSYSNIIRRKINITRDPAVAPAPTREPIRINSNNENPVIRNSTIAPAPNRESMWINSNNVNSSIAPAPRRESMWTNSNNENPVTRNSIQNNTSQATTFNDDDLQLNADMFEDDNFDIAELEEIENRVVNANTSTNHATNHRDANRIESSFLINDDPMLIEDPITLDDSFERRSPMAVNFSPPLSLETPPTAKFPILTNKDPYVYIKQIASLSEDDTNGKVFILKAQVYKVVGKLSLKKAWILRCTLIDGSGGLNVDVESDVLSKIIEYTPEDMWKLKKQMASDPSLKPKLVEALSSAMNKIQNLDCLYHIVYKSSVPQVFKIEEVKQAHILQLRERLSSIL